jgi:hypothetical protein
MKMVRTARRSDNSKADVLWKVINILISQKVGNFFDISATIRFSGRVLPHEFTSKMNTIIVFLNIIHRPALTLKKLLHEGANRMKP